MDEEQLQIFDKLPLAIQRMEANKQAFKLPDLKLPSYEDFGKNIDNVFTRTPDNKLVPREPSFQEQLNESVRRSSNIPDLLNPIGEYSKNDVQGFNNPMLPYDPTVNMAEMYAKYDPFTWGDSFERAWDTASLNMWNGTKNLWYGLKEGITDGRVSALSDNKYSKELAELTENYEKMNPMYFTEEEQDSLNTWLKQVFPSIGYVASSVVEMAAQHAAFTVVGAAIGAVSGGGVGAIPGAIAGNIVALGKDVQTLSNAVTNLSRAARAINTLSTANKIKKGAQLLGYGLLGANGEAALNAQMATHSAIEKEKARYFEQTGRYLSGDELKNVEEKAHNIGSTTFALNLPLIAATQIFQFGNLLRGKFASQAIESLPFYIDDAGKAVMKKWGAARQIGGRFALESGSEGFEELMQGVIEDASVNYFLQKEENRRNYLDIFARSAFERATSSEGLSEFAAGALIGGISNITDVADPRNYSTVRKNTEAFVNSYNTSTEQYFDYLGKSLKTNDNLKDAIKRGDTLTAQDIHRKSIIDMVNHHAKVGSTEAFMETLDAMSDMDNKEFRSTFGIEVTPEEQRILLQSVSNEYKSAAETRRRIDSAFQINPFEAESWFQKKINSMKSSYNVDKEKANKVWEVFKDKLTSNMVRFGDVDNKIALLESMGNREFEGFSSLTGLGAADIVTKKKAELKAIVDAKLPGYEKEQMILNNLEGKSIKEQYAMLLNDAEAKAPGIKEFLAEYNYHLGMREMLFKENNSLNNRAGQRKAIKKILDWMDYYESKIAEEAPAPEEAPVPATAEEIAAGAAPISQVPVVTETPETAETAETAETGEIVEQIEGATITAPPTPPTPPTTPTTPTPGIQTTIPFDEVQAIEQEVIRQQDVESALDEETEPVFVPDNFVDDEEAFAEFFGEGKTEDVPTQPRQQIGRQEQEEAKPTRKKIEGVIDPELPQDVQINEAATTKAVEELNPGEIIIPEDSGVEITHRGEPVESIERVVEETVKENQTTKKEKVKVRKKGKDPIDLPENEIPLLETKSIDLTNNQVAATIQNEDLNTEESDFLRNLFDNGYIEFDC